MWTFTVLVRLAHPLRRRWGKFRHIFLCYDHIIRFSLLWQEFHKYGINNHPHEWSSYRTGGVCVSQELCLSQGKLMLGEASIRAKFRKSLWKKKVNEGPAQPDWDWATGEPPYSQAWGRGSRENAWWRCISPMGPWDPDLGERGLGSLLRLQPRNSARAKVQWIKGQTYQISHFSYFILQTYLRKVISN